MLICGCIEKITPYELRVSLPHQNIGYIPLNMISDEYTELIEQKMSSTSTENFEDLDDLFHLGQFVICRVIESQSNNENENEKTQKRLHLSINPKDVSDQITPENLVKGMVNSHPIILHSFTSKSHFRYYQVSYQVLLIMDLLSILAFHNEKVF